MIIQTKTPMNPIYSFLCHSWKQTKAEKLEILKTIDEFYNLSKVIHTDLYQIRKDGRFLWGEYVRPNLTILFDFCGSKGKKYLLKVFGKSYSITSPLSWRFERRKHFTWVALEMVNRNFKNGKCSIEHQGNQFQVIINGISKFKNYLLLSLLIPTKQLQSIPPNCYDNIFKKP